MYNTERKKTKQDVFPEENVNISSKREKNIFNYKTQ